MMALLDRDGSEDDREEQRRRVDHMEVDYISYAEFDVAGPTNWTLGDQ